MRDVVLDARLQFGLGTRRAVPAHGWDLDYRGTVIEATRSGVPGSVSHRRIELLA
jgi:hypothetical protein